MTDPDPVSAREIADVLADIAALGPDPSPEHLEEVMSRKRALIERIEPGFYDPDPAYPPTDDYGPT